MIIRVGRPDMNNILGMPGMHGWIRLLCGRVRISSFSWLNNDEESALLKVRHDFDEAGDAPRMATRRFAALRQQHKPVFRPARFEGVNFDTRISRQSLKFKFCAQKF